MQNNKNKGSQGMNATEDLFSFEPSPSLCSGDKPQQRGELVDHRAGQIKEAISFRGLPVCAHLVGGRGGALGST